MGDAAQQSPESKERSLDKKKKTMVEWMNKKNLQSRHQTWKNITWWPPKKNC